MTDGFRDLYGGGVRVLRKAVSRARRMVTSSPSRTERFISGGVAVSYAQCGEDIIVRFALQQLGISAPTYLDIGANDPVYFSNTYMFYRAGCRGVCVEPNPELCSRIIKYRPRDVCLNAGIGFGGQKEGAFFVMSADTLSTFSREDAERFQSYGTYSIQAIRSVPLYDINDIVAQHFRSAPDFLSIDVEGWDIRILEALNLSVHRPAVLCAETLTYAEDGTERKISEIKDFMFENGYFEFADTYLNTVFVDQVQWQQRLGR